MFFPVTGEEHLAKCLDLMTKPQGIKRFRFTDFLQVRSLLTLWNPLLWKDICIRPHNTVSFCVSDPVGVGQLSQQVLESLDSMKLS